MADQGVRVLGLRPSWKVISPRSARGPSVRLAVLVLAAAILLSASSAQAALDLKRYYRKSVAVVIGIDKYPRWQPRLQWAVRDARRLAEALKKDWGFDKVYTLLDSQATREKILSFLKYDLPPKLGPQDRVFIFYSGHGATEKVGNIRYGYLVPFDADQKRPFLKSIKMRDLRDLVEALPAKHVFLALDACFSGTLLEKGSGGIGKQDDAYYEIMRRRKVRQGVAAGTAEQESFEVGGSGFFTHQLLRGLSGEADTNTDGVITGCELGIYLVARVPNRAWRDHRRELTPTFGKLSGAGIFCSSLRHDDPLLLPRRRTESPVSFKRPMGRLRWTS